MFRSYTQCYEVQKIIGKRIAQYGPSYLIKWRNYPIQDSTWQPLHNLISIGSIIDVFEKQNFGSRLPIIYEEYTASMKDTRMLLRELKTYTMTKRKLKKVKMVQKEKVNYSGKSGKEKWNETTYESEYEEEIQLDNDQTTSTQKRQKDNNPYHDSLHKVFHNLTFQKQDDEETSNDSSLGKSLGIDIFGTKSLSTDVRDIKFVKRVAGKSLFELDNVYLVRYFSGEEKEMRSWELVEAHQDEFIKFLQSYVK